MGAGWIATPRCVAVIYFIHDQTNRTIKIGCSWSPRKRLSTLQISTSNELVLLGKIPGTKKVEKEVHLLVYRYAATNPVPGARHVCVSGEWFDDRILPFVTELMVSPQTFLRAKPKKPPRARPADNELRDCSLVVVCDSGETFRESFTLKAASPELALAALTNIADARLTFLAHTARIARLVVPGVAKDVSLRGALAAKCNPRHGLAVTINSELDHSLGMEDGVKQYLHRWFHGVPPEFYQAVDRWHSRATPQCEMLLRQFAQVLNQNQCVIVAQTVLPVRGVFPHGFGRLPKGELRSKVNQKVAGRRRQRVLDARPKDGIVYFIQDAVKTDIKIGFCLKQPEKRLAALQTGNSNPLRLVGHVPGSEAHEKGLHRRFSRFRTHGEWFSNAVLADVYGILKCPSVEEWLRHQDPTSPAGAPVEAVAPDDVV